MRDIGYLLIHGKTNHKLKQMSSSWIKSKLNELNLSVDKAPESPSNDFKFDGFVFDKDRENDPIGICAKCDKPLINKDVTNGNADFDSGNNWIHKICSNSNDMTHNNIKLNKKYTAKWKDKHISKWTANDLYNYMETLPNELLQYRHIICDQNRLNGKDLINTSDSQWKTLISDKNIRHKFKHIIQSLNRIKIKKRSITETPPPPTMDYDSISFKTPPPPNIPKQLAKKRKNPTHFPKVQRNRSFTLPYNKSSNNSVPPPPPPASTRVKPNRTYGLPPPITLTFSSTNESIHDIISLNSDPDTKSEELKETNDITLCELKFQEWFNKIRLDSNIKKKYLNQFIQAKSNNITYINLFDDEILRDEIHIKSKLHRKIILQKCNQFCKQKTSFDNWWKNIIHSDNILDYYYERFESHGLITKQYIINNVKSKSILRNILFGIHDEYNKFISSHLDTLWFHIQSLSNPKQCVNEGQKVDDTKLFY